MKMLACITVERSVLCGSLVGEVFSAFRALFEDFIYSRRKALALFAPMPFAAARSASCRKGLRVLEIDAFFEVPRTV